MNEYPSSQDPCEGHNTYSPNSMGIHYTPRQPFLFRFLWTIIEFVFTAAMIVICLWAAGIL
jgi:hypothetical protein